MRYQVCEPLYSANLNCTKKYTVNQGGTSSAKTYTILQVLFDIACTQHDQIITIAGQDIPNLKKGPIRDALKIVSTSHHIQWHLRNYHKTGGYNKSERIFEFRNGSIIEFSSYDNEQDAKSGKRDYLFVNEANGIAYPIFWQLAYRTRKRVFIDYNPTAKFWVHEKLIGNADVQLFISDHRHNQFLTQAQHDEIENIPDPELWKVYARGKTGMIKGLIYPRFQVIEAMPPNIPFVYGLDFGFNHKTALIEIAKDDTRLFVNELVYQSELTIGDLLVMMKDLGLGNRPIYADHAAADKIEDLKRAKYNVYKADKDVLNGIDFVKRHSLYVTKNSTGVRKEIMSYKWKEKDGVPLDEPVKFNDDGMDAMRYGAYSGRKNKGIIIANTGGTSPLDWLD